MRTVIIVCSESVTSIGRYTFRDCSSLNYIKAFFTTNVNDPALPESPYLQEWTLRVSDSGTFVKNRNAFWTSGVVPYNWTVISTIP